MSLYATAVGVSARPGCCVFVHHWEDVDMHCPERGIPGGEPLECAEHYIARIHLAALPTYRRWFGAPS